MFLPQASARALYAPPIGWGLITSAGDAWERIGRFAWTGFGGVLMIEATKRLYIEPGRPARVKRVVKVPARRSLRASIDKTPSSKGPPLQIQSGTLATGNIEIASRRPLSMVLPILRELTGL